MNFTAEQFVKFANLNHRRLAHIQRYNTTPVAIRESVAEHSYFVTMYVWMLCEYLIDRGEKIDVLKAMKRGLIHDIEESISGDIIMTFKYKNKEFAESLQKLNLASMEELTKDLPDKLSKEIKREWEDAKDLTKEGFIVKAADKLSLMTYCIEQLRIGNKYFEPIYGRAVKAISDMNLPWLDEILEQFIKFNNSSQVE